MAKKGYFKKDSKKDTTLDMQKLIPIGVAVILGIIAIILLISNSSKNNAYYNTLTVNYHNEKEKYTDLNNLREFSVNNQYSFRVAAHENQRVILISEINLTVNKKEVEANKEIEIYGNEKYDICVEADECFDVVLSK